MKKIEYMIAKDFYEDLQKWNDESEGIYDDGTCDPYVYDVIMTWASHIREYYGVKYTYRLYEFCKWFLDQIKYFGNTFMNKSYFEFFTNDEGCFCDEVVRWAVDFYCFDEECYEDYDGDFWAYWVDELAEVIE